VNVKLIVEYDGTSFAGWQLQPGCRTVEGELRDALARLPLRLDRLYAAGRTDAGAHAEGQVVNIHCESDLHLGKLRPALNGHLPHDVAVLEAAVVPDDFHARYSARWRRYRYRYLDRPARPGLGRAHVWYLPAQLDVEAMQEAASQLVGIHDWTTFCSAAEPERRRVREIREARLARCGRHVDLELVGQGFLRGMVRSIASALAQVGLHRRPPEWVAEILGGRDRKLAPATAPASGLTLVEVEY
jgi:tRNA pseudouridine38-40 synthase